MTAPIRNMIRAFIIDFSTLTNVPASPFVTQRTRASFAAHRTLEIMYRSIFNERLPETERTPEGKPYLRENPHGVYFNVSHTDSYAAVLLTDEGECGVDIEAELPPARAERIDRRYLSGLDMSVDTLATQPQIIAARLPSPLDVTDLCELCAVKSQKKPDGMRCQSGEISLTELEISNELSAVSRWTLLEAVLKADGRGFAAYKEADDIKAACVARHYLYKDGENKLYISVAIKKKQV